MKNFFFDLETTGLNADQHSIHQLSAIIEIDGDIKSTLNFKIKPYKDISPEALAVSGVTYADVMDYPPIEDSYSLLIGELTKYIDRFDKKDKFHLIGYNNCAFDNRFLRALFSFMGDNYFGSWFWSDSIDTLVVASHVLREQRSTMLNFKLHTVAKQLGIELDETKLHDAMYDVQLTREIYLLCSEGKIF